MADTVDIESHARWILEGLNEQRKGSSDLCDLEIQVGATSFVAHKAILCRASEYFNALLMGNFVETDSKSVNLSSMIEKPQIFQTILDYMYTGALPVSKETIVDLLHATSLLLLDKAKKTCVKYLFEHLTLENCVETFELTEKYDIVELSLVAVEMLRSHCHDHVIHSEQLIGCPVNILTVMAIGGVFRNVQPKDLHEMIHKRLTRREFSKQDTEVQVEELDRTFSALSDLSPLVKQTYEKIIASATPDCDKKEIQNLIQSFISNIQDQAKEQSANALSNGFNALGIETTAAHQEAIFILWKDSKSGLNGNAHLYAYLTAQKIWVELVEYERKQGGLDISTKLMTGIEYESGMNLCYRVANLSITPGKMFDLETFQSKTCIVEDKHHCGGSFEDNQNYFCYKGGFYCFTRTKYGLPDFSNESAVTVTHSHDEYVLLKHDGDTGWKEVLRFPVGEEQKKAEVTTYVSAFTQVQCQYVVSDRGFDILIDHQCATTQEAEQSPSSAKKVFLYHFEELSNGDLSYKALPILHFEPNQTPFRLKYVLTADRYGVCLVPVHTRTVCLSARIYRYSHWDETWRISVVDESLNEAGPEEPASQESLDVSKTRMVVKSVPNSLSVVEIPGEQILSIKENSEESKAIGVISSMPGQILPIIVKKDSPSGVRIQNMFYESPHQYLQEQGLLKSLYQCSDLIGSGQSNMLYQMRIKGPYVTELWVYHVDNNEWKPLPAPPVHNCLEMKVGFLPMKIEDKMAVRFNSSIPDIKLSEENTSLFSYYRLMSEEEYKAQNGEDEVRSDDDDDDMDDYPLHYPFDDYGYDGDEFDIYDNDEYGFEYDDDDDDDHDYGHDDFIF